MRVPAGLIETVEFGRLPILPSPENLKPRPDRRAVATVLPHDSQMRVGELSAAGWRCDAPHARAGFLNLKGCVVVDGQSGPTYAGLGTTAPVWNPTGQALAYFAITGLKTTFIVCDGRAGQRCTAFVDGSLTWHAAGSMVGC